MRDPSGRSGSSLGGRKTNLSTGVVAVNASGAEAAADMRTSNRRRLYIGYDRAENFVSPGGSVHDFSHVYVAGMPRLNEWGLAGKWTIGGEHAVLDQKDGSIVYRFHARDLHLVLDRGRTVSRSDSASAIDGAHPAPATARMSMPTARAS